MSTTLKKAWITVAVLAAIAFGVSCVKAQDTSDTNVRNTSAQVTEGTSDDSSSEESMIWVSGECYI